jgi:hypothetical protein
MGGKISHNAGDAQANGHPVENFGKKNSRGLLPGLC